MSYYVVVTHDVVDPDRYNTEYIPGAVEVIMRHGGEVAVAAEDVDRIEGEPSTPRCVILRFPSAEAFRAWYDDPDYEPLKQVRYSITSNSVMIGASGFGDGS